LVAILKTRGIEYGKNSYAVVNPESIILTDDNKGQYIKKVIEAGYSEEMWQSLAESDPTLAIKLSYAKIQQTRKEIIKQFKKRLKTDSYSETNGDNSWQRFIYTHNWLFGVNYKKPIEKTKISISGIMPDYLFPTIDGFVDILEIKLPKDPVIREDTSHPGSWKWSPEANSAIGQVVNYLSEIDRQRLEIEKNIKDKYAISLSLLKPRVYILIGNSTDWTSSKRDGLRKLNHSLHGIEIITYSDLLNRGLQATNIES